VLALLATGKLAGSRLLGNFQETDEYLTMNFNLLVTKDGRSIPISAIVLDPETSLPGVITEIDRRYLQRVIVPAAAEFISGVGEAIAKTKESTTQNSATTATSNEEPDFNEAIAQGISDSFDDLSDTFKEEAGKTKIKLRVAAGTPIGILFTQDVIDPDTIQKVEPEKDQAANNPFGFVPGNFAYVPGQPIFPYGGPQTAPNGGYPTSPGGGAPTAPATTGK
jgi:intracellular multiplication protein IcmE